MKNTYFFLLEFFLIVFAVVQYIWIPFAQRNIFKTSPIFTKEGKKGQNTSFWVKIQLGELNLLNSIILKFFVLNSTNLINFFIEFDKFNNIFA